MVNWQLASVVPTWVFALAAAVLVALLLPADDRFLWLPLGLAGALVLAFAVQLGLRRREGFVLRVGASVTGAVVILGLASLVYLAIA